MSEYVLETSNLTKTYARKNAVDNIDIKIRKGDIYGFIGKNGAGKTTTIRLVVGLARPTSGTIELFGSTDLKKGREKIGTVIENPALYPYMSARQNIEVQRIMKGVKDKSITDELLNIVGLGDTGRKKAKNFSLGMKQRLAIALALVGDPEFLFLDEPINGLDPSGIRDIRDLIIQLNKEIGITIMISSHILGELSKVATAYGIISDGVLVDQFTVEELGDKTKPSFTISVSDPKQAVWVFNEKLGISDFEVHENIIKINEKTEKSDEIFSQMQENDVICQLIKKESGNLEDYFIKLMGPMVKISVNNPEKAAVILRETLNISDFDIHKNVIKIFEKNEDPQAIVAAFEKEGLIVKLLTEKPKKRKGMFIRSFKGGNAND